MQAPSLSPLIFMLPEALPLVAIPPSRRPPPCPAAEGPAGVLLQGEKGRWPSRDRPVLARLPSTASLYLILLLAAARSERRTSSFVFGYEDHTRGKARNVRKLRLLTRHRGTGLPAWTRCPLSGSCRPSRPAAAGPHSLSWTEGRGNRADPRGACGEPCNPSPSSGPAPRRELEEGASGSLGELLLRWLVGAR